MTAITRIPRLAASGSLCPTCRWCATYQVRAHLCITTGDPERRHLLTYALAFKPGEEIARLLEDLDVHPAQPLLWTGERADIPIIRPVDRSWCFCQCQTEPATPPPGGARA